MTDLSTKHLQHLLAETSPGPWEARDSYRDGDARPDDSHQILDAAGEYLGIMHDPDAHLTALAPPLAQEVLRMREELQTLREQLKKKAEYYHKVELSSDPLDGIELEDHYAEEEFSRILGDHDE